MSNSSSLFDPLLEALAYDTPALTALTEVPPPTDDDLALWTNAQFTFDTTPGSAVLDTPTLSKGQSEYPHEERKNDIDWTSLLNIDPPVLESAQQQHPVRSGGGPRLLFPKVDPSSSTTLVPLPLPPPTVIAPSNNDNRKRSADDLDKEQDKRRRNTAASARFRAKKKMREQAMQRTVLEMTQKSEQLTERVKTLKQEIKWLRTLLLDKQNTEGTANTQSSSFSSSS